MKIANKLDRKKFSLEVFINKYYYQILLIISVFLAFVCFWNLGDFTVQDWDESRHGVSAYEMLKNGENLINTYNYENDYWNLKPPLSFNFIIIAYKIFGTSIYAFRFPSAIAMFLIGIILAFFTSKKYGKLESLYCLTAFSVCTPLFKDHAGRYGDADSLFILFFTVAMISMLLIDKNKKYIYLCGFSFALAFLTKSWHAFIIVGIGGLFLLFTGEIKKLKLKQWIIVILSFTIPIGIWVIARIIKDGTKFLVEMVRYDLLKRSNEAIEGHVGSVFFYFKYILLNGTSLVLALGILILVGVLLYYKKWKLAKNDVIGYGLWILLPLILFSLVKTKIEWYILPIYIPLIIVGAVFCVKILKDSSIFKLIKIGLSLIFIAALIFQGYCILKYVNNPTEEPLQKFIMATLRDNQEVKGEDAYIDIENEQWKQSQLFIGELYGDLKCKEGGIKGFANDKDAILITKKSKYLENKETFKGDKVISENHDYIIVINAE